MTKEKLDKYHASFNKIDFIFILGAALVGILLNWSNMEVIIFTFFIAAVLRPFSSKFFAIPALFFLSVAPFLLIMERKEKAEEFSIYAYYFLAMAVIMGIYEIRTKEKFDTEI